MGRTINIIIGLLIVMVPVGLFMMLGADTAKQYLWSTSIFLGLQAIAAFIFLVSSAEHKSVTLTAFFILFFSFAVEFLGIKTGVPFGSYTYTQTLRPALLGVPLSISFSWFTVVVNSFLISKFLLQGSKRIYILLLSAVIILAIDLMLEPFALINNFWVWENGKIPLQNYLSWFVLGFIFSYLLENYVAWNRNIFLNISFITIPSIIVSINILQFTVVNFCYGYFIITITGLAILALCILLSLKLRPDES